MRMLCRLPFLGLLVFHSIIGTALAQIDPHSQVVDGQGGLCCVGNGFQACATCPQGYIRGCREGQEGNYHTCRFFCSENDQGMAEMLYPNDPQSQFRVRDGLRELRSERSQYYRSGLTPKSHDYFFQRNLPWNGGFEKSLGGRVRVWIPE